MIYQVISFLLSHEREVMPSKSHIDCYRVSFLSSSIKELSVFHGWQTTHQDSINLARNLMYMQFFNEL